MARTNYTELAQEIKALAKERGVQVSGKGTVVTVSKTFPAGDSAAYVQAENDCLVVLARVRTNSPGSTWGTDSGSIGGHVGLQGGYCRLQKSGVVKTLAKNL